MSFGEVCKKSGLNYTNSRKQPWKMSKGLGWPSNVQILFVQLIVKPNLIGQMWRLFT